MIATGFPIPTVACRFAGMDDRIPSSGVWREKLKLSGNTWRAEWSRASHCEDMAGYVSRAEVTLEGHGAKGSRGEDMGRRTWLGSRGDGQGGGYRVQGLGRGVQGFR